MDASALRDRIEEHIRLHDLIPPGGRVCCLVSGGADSTCLWHALRALGYEVSAVHVNHGLRARESDEDAEFCREAMAAEVIDARDFVADSHKPSEAVLRAVRYSFARDRLRATGHTASDQVETLLYRLAASGTTKAIKPRREDGVVRPLLTVWRHETEEYCRVEGRRFRVDSTNADTKRGLIRDRIVPLLRELHPAAEENLLRAVSNDARLPRAAERAFGELIASLGGSKRVDLGGGRVAVREYEQVWVEPAPVALDGPVRWGKWSIEPRRPGLHVRTWRPGDRLSGRSKKVQDLFVDAKVPRSERQEWPIIVRGSEVVVVPGIAAAAGCEGAVEARCET